MSNLSGDHSLTRLVYVSRASVLMRNKFREQVESIVNLSERNNTALGVTGILIAHQGWFVQALEGSHDDVLNLYARIAEDPWHEDVRTVAVEPITERRFESWGMCAGRLPASLVETTANLATLTAAELIALLNASSPYAVGPSLSAAQAMDVLDTLPEQQFDDIVSAARALARSRAAVIWLSDGARRWFKASVGLDVCALDIDAPFLIQGMLAPSVLWSSALGVEAGGVAFHACAPLRVSGRPVGVLCVFDDRPRTFDAAAADGLSALARSAISRLEAQADERVAARLLSSATDAIISSDGELKISFWNPAAERLFGRSAGEAVGLPLEIIFPERLRAEWRERLENLRYNDVQDADALAMPALSADGGEFAAELTLAVWRDGASNAVGAIIRDITPRHLAEAALKAAKAAAEGANAAKSAFLANMSHEIRTPLNGIIGLAGLLVDSRLPPREHEMAELIRAAGDQLQHILGDILDVARMEAGAVSVAHEGFSVADLATTVLGLFSPAAAQKRLALNLQMDSDAAARVLGDAGRVEQILSNLLSNAVKFTDTGSVTLAVSRQSPGLFRFVVEDTGIGFEPAIKEQIFGRFQQADSSITRRFGGAGLGLAVCKQVVDLLGGQIDCYSTPGQGAHFEVLLPLEPAEALNDDLQSKPGAIAPPAAEPPEARLRVLVADDNPTNRRLVELILDSLNAEVLSVEDGALALEAFTLQPFDVVLMDMMMPVMDGLSATLAIRRHEQRLQLPPTPVLMISANTLAEHIDAAAQAGVNGYLMKPFTAPQLITAIDEAFSAPANRLVHAA
jgi:PAS domain S-box-containing protein